MTHLVIAYPTLPAAGRAWIDRVRERHHHQLANVVAPHFTFVFPHLAPDPAALVAHVRRCAAGVATIPFVLRSTRAVPEPGGERASLFLVPDEGYDPILNLHDALYTDILASELRHDLPFIPHVTVGLVDLPAREIVGDLDLDIESLADALAGSIDRLDVVARDAGVTTIARVPLRDP